MSQQHPVVVIGAGPIGLAAAAHLRERNQHVRVLEAGSTASAAIREWGHIKLFSTWRYNIDTAARRLLTATPTAWQEPRETRLPTGNELITEYLEPLAAHPELAPHISYDHRVTHISRLGRNGSGVDKAQSGGRDDALFLVRADSPAGPIDVIARAVIDASGTWKSPNTVGRSGLEAIGEPEARARGFITSPLPDPLERDRERFAGKRTLVVGAGHSAINTLISLGRLRGSDPETEILWGLRGAANPIRLYGGGAADELPARGQLGERVRRLVENGDITIIEHLSIARLSVADRLTVTTADGTNLVVDNLVPATGFKPDLKPLSELRLDLDQVVEAPTALGPLIDPQFHSCGTVAAHGARILAHPEKNFYIVGMKSYGRAPTFLMATGYEQVRSIAAALSGDHEAADLVELELPETGVCSANAVASCDSDDASDATACGSAPAPAASCCEPGTGAEPVQVGFSTGTLHGFTELARS